MNALPRRILLCAVLALALGAGSLAAENVDTLPPGVHHIAETPWSGAGSPFTFETDDTGQKNIRVGNETYALMTEAELAADQNPGRTNRHVAIVSDLGSFTDNEKARQWFITLTEIPAVKFYNPDLFYEDGVKMMRLLEINDPVMVLGTAEVAGNGSTIKVTKVYRIPNEITRLTQDFITLRDSHPDYDAFKAMADSLEVKANAYTAHNDAANANKLTNLRSQVVNELLTLRASYFRGNKLSVDEEIEFMKASLKYAPTDRDAAAEILKDILKKAPDNKAAVEARAPLLPDWIKCPETKTWMAQADCDKRRQIEMTKIADEQKHQHDVLVEHMNSVAGMTLQRHAALLKNQAQLVDGGYKLPADGSDAFKSMAATLSTSDDFRLVREILLQSVTELEPAEWARLIPAAITNPNVEIRLLGYRLGAFSNDRSTVLALADALVDDPSDAVKTDAVLAMSESRTPIVVQGLVHCMERNHDDHLNQVLLQQLQQLTHRQEVDLAAWQKYASDASKITVVPE